MGGICPKKAQGLIYFLFTIETKCYLFEGKVSSKLYGATSIVSYNYCLKHGYKKENATLLPHFTKTILINFNGFPFLRFKFLAPGI